MLHACEILWKGRPRLARLPVGLFALGLLAGCAGGPEQRVPPRGGQATPAAAPATVPGGDPVIAFAARAQPGAAEALRTADGQPATARLVRAYHAASGRECREVALDAGLSEQSRLLCRDGARWVDAQPLLRGGAAARP